MNHGLDVAILENCDCPFRGSDDQPSAAFEAMVRRRAGGLLVWREAYFTLERALIVGRAVHHVIPTVCGPRLFAEIGGLKGYGPTDTSCFVRLVFMPGEF